MTSVKTILCGVIVALTFPPGAMAQVKSADELGRELGFMLAPAEQSSAGASRSIANLQQRSLEKTSPGASPVAAASGPVQTAPVPAILFEKGSARIKPESYPQLQQLVVLLKTVPADAKIGIVGHTDAAGSSEYNLRLSRERAIEVAAFLTDRGGIAPELIYCQGVGKTQMVRPDDPSAAENRAVLLQRLR